MGVKINGVEVTQELGVDQTWQDFLGVREIGVVYTNSTTKPIMVAVTQNGGGYSGASLYIDDIRIGYSSSYGNESAIRASSSGVVPVGGTYYVSGSTEVWSELREAV